jgi:predicted MFS family arabinose efflux permease
MVALAFLGQNLGFGLFNGSFGALVGQLEQQVGISRAKSALGFSVQLVVLAVTCTLAGNFLSARNLRWIMSGGVMLFAVAFLVLSMATTYPVYLLSFALAGVAIGLSTVICPLLLVCRWFNAKRGLALGIANTPLLLPLTPPLTVLAVPLLGMQKVLWIDAAICLAIALIIMLFLVERPADVRQSALGGDAGIADDAHIHGGHSSGSLGFLRDWRFWAIALSLGLLNGSASSFISHIVPYATELGLSLQEASSFIFIFGIAGLVGVPLGGLLADKIGGVTVLALMSLATALFFATMTLEVPTAAILVFCAVYGALLNGIIACQGVAFSELFRPDQVGRIVGTIFLAQLPIMSSAPSIIGYLRDKSGSYTQPFQLMAALAIVGFAVFLVIAMGLRKKRVTAAA